MTELIFWKITITAWLIAFLINLGRTRKELDDGFIVFQNLIMTPIYVAVIMGIIFVSIWFILFYWG